MRKNPGVKELTKTIALQAAAIEDLQDRVAELTMTNDDLFAAFSDIGVAPADLPHLTEYKARHVLRLEEVRRVFREVIAEYGVPAKEAADAQ